MVINMKPSSILGSCSRRALPRALSSTNNISPSTTTPLRLNAPLLSPRGSHGDYGFNRPTPVPKVPRVLNTTPLTYGRASEIVGYLGTRKFPASLRGGTSFGPGEMCCTYWKCAAHFKICNSMCCTFGPIIDIDLRDPG